MNTNTAYIVSVSVGAALGFVLFIMLMLFKGRIGKKTGPTRRCKTMGYGDLIEFADNCKKEFPQALKSLVVCERRAEGGYRITQTILDAQQVIRVDSNKVLARIIECKGIDDKIAALCRGKDDVVFEFQI